MDTKANILWAAETLGVEYVSAQAYEFTRFRGNSWLTQGEFASRVSAEASALLMAREEQLRAQAHARQREVEARNLEERRRQAAAWLLLDSD